MRKLPSAPSRRHSRVAPKPSGGLLVAVATACVVAAVIVLTVVLVQRNVNRPAAKETTIVAPRATSTYSETFDTTTYRDAGATTANWDTFSGELALPTSAGNFYQADNVTLGNNDASSLAQGLRHTRKALALDSNDRPNIIWCNFTTAQMNFTKWNGVTWTKADGTSAGFDTIATTAGNGCQIHSLVLDTQDQPHVAWAQGTTVSSAMAYSQWNGSSWVEADGVTPGFTLASPAAAIRDLSMTLDLTSDGRPGLTWVDSSSGSFDALYTEWNGSTFGKADGTAGIDNVSAITNSGNPPGADNGDLVFDVNDRPTITYTGSTGGPLDLSILFTRWNGTAWVQADGATAGASFVAPTTGTVAYRSVLQLKPNGDPAIAWLQGGGPWDVEYSEWNGTSFVRADGVTPGYDTLNTATANDINPTLQLTSDGRPALAWNQSGIFYVEWSPSSSSWVGADGTAGPQDVTAALSPAASVTSLALDDDDNPNLTGVRVAGLGNRDVHFTHWIEPCAASGIAQSTTFDSAADPIQSATLSATHSLNGGTIDYSLSNDGGVTFEPVTTGVSHTFTTSGSDLRWRASLTRTSADLTACPSIESLSINYDASGQVVRVAGQDPIELAINVSTLAFPQVQSAPVAVLGRSDLLIDEFVSTPLVSLTNATLLLTPPTALDPRTLAELQRVLTPGGKIYLLGGEAAITPAVATALSAAGFSNQERLGGARRFETAVAIGSAVLSLNPSTSNRAFLTESDFLVDAFSAGPAAGDKSADGRVDVILLSERSRPTLNAATATFLAAQPQLTQVELVGGPAALPATLEQAVAAVRPGATVVRRAGANRFATGQVLNDLYFALPTIVVIANGEGPHIPGSLSATSSGSSGLFTALLAGAFAAKRASPLVLTEALQLPAESAAYIRDHAGTLGTAIVIGSSADVSDLVVQQVQGAL